MVQDGIIWNENQDWQDEIVFESLVHTDIESLKIDCLRFVVCMLLVPAFQG
jgi:hypothetical protein